MKSTLTQLDILLVNYVSVTTLPETVPAFTAFMKMKNERSFLPRISNFYVENGKEFQK